MQSPDYSELSRLRDDFRYLVRIADVDVRRQLPVVESAKRLADAYRRWRIPEIGPSDRIEIFAPTLVRSQSQSNWNSAPQIVTAYNSGYWQFAIMNMCLYADRLWLPDPLEFLASVWEDGVPAGIGNGQQYFSPYIRAIGVHGGFTVDRRNPDYAHSTALTLDLFLERLEPLIHSGAICLYPAIATYRNHIAVPLFGDLRYFTEDEMDHAWPDLYVAEGLLYAKAFDASYTALRHDEFQALQRGAEELSRFIGVADHRVLAALPRMTLPFFGEMEVENLVNVRANDETFADFRKLLRELSRDLVAGVEDPAFDTEVRRLEKEKVEPGLKKLVQDINGTTSLKARLSDFCTDFTAGALGTLVLKADVKEALLGGTATALAKALGKLLMQRTEVRPAASAVYEFHTGKKPRTILP